ncbi:MAG TPA: TRAM domain-containing protein [Candidatus Dormibacteraeota bacterium]|nr:TRAM domain-containing protein [Candidatus Dormibacteraeota bacterium]
MLRVIFAVILAATGFLLGREAYIHMLSEHVVGQFWQVTLLLVAPVVGAIVGVVVAPSVEWLFQRELTEAESSIERMSPPEILGGAIGLIVGLVIAFLIRLVLLEWFSVAGPSGTYVGLALYLILSVFCVYLGVRVGVKQRLGWLARTGTAVPPAQRAIPKIVDTSVIIDGRIVDIVKTGFVDGPIVVPRFVLRELQMIADSLDSLKRTRGRRGLEVLSTLQEIQELEISESDYADIHEVDAKLVRLAKDRRGKLLTNDYNLNRVAQLEGVVVLNINELANAVKPVVLPGEELNVGIIRDGKEQNQGVGYLDDGTMIVVENGRRLIGEHVDVQVTSVLQTVAGRMIFARPKR